MGESSCNINTFALFLLVLSFLLRWFVATREVCFFSLLPPGALDAEFSLVVVVLVPTT